MKPPQPLKAVYSYYFPQVRKLIEQVFDPYPHDVFLQSIDPGLDDFHLQTIQYYQEYHVGQMKGLNGYEHNYHCNGASEALFHILAYIASHYPHAPLYTIPGEYEGYEAYGNNIGLDFEKHELDVLMTVRPGIVFLSNPNSRDGGIIPNHIVNKLCEYGHKLIYDMTYVGLVQPQLFDVSHPNILAVIASLSKPFGVYYHRIGFCFSRIPIMTLAPNKWFKNINSLLIANKLLTNIKPGQLYEKYKPYQDKAIHALSQQIGTEITPSNILLLGIHKGRLPKKYDIYNRGPNYRFCLTPYFLEQETSTS